MWETSVKYLCRAPNFQNAVLEKSTGSATPIINKGKWERIVIPFPPLLEQQTIISTVKRLMALCDSLEQEVASSAARAELWMKGAVREVVGE